jgi:hypothetical protein
MYIVRLQINRDEFIYVNRARTLAEDNVLLTGAMLEDGRWQVPVPIR